MSKETGGPAFPSPDWNGSWKGPDANHGMSLRDYFAGQALTEFASLIDLRVPNTLKVVAGLSYEMADAMLAHRNREAGDE